MPLACCSPEGGPPVCGFSGAQPPSFIIRKIYMLMARMIPMEKTTHATTTQEDIDATFAARTQSIESGDYDMADDAARLRASLEDQAQEEVWA